MYIHAGTYHTYSTHRAYKITVVEQQRTETTIKLTRNHGQGEVAARPTNSII